MEKLKVKLSNLLNGLTIREALEATDFSIMGDLEAVMKECVAMASFNHKVHAGDLSCEVIREEVLACSNLKDLLKVINHDAYKLLNDAGCYTNVVSFDAYDDGDDGESDSTYSDRLEAQIVRDDPIEEVEYSFNDLAKADITMLNADQLRAFACLMAERNLIVLPDHLSDFCKGMTYSRKHCKWSGGKILKGANYANAIADLREFMEDCISKAKESDVVYDSNVSYEADESDVLDDTYDTDASNEAYESNVSYEPDVSDGVYDSNVSYEADVSDGVYDSNVSYEAYETDETYEAYESNVSYEADVSVDIYESNVYDSSYTSDVVYDSNVSYGSLTAWPPLFHPTMHNVTIQHAWPQALGPPGPCRLPPSIKALVRHWRPFLGV